MHDVLFGYKRAICIPSACHTSPPVSNTMTAIMPLNIDNVSTALFNKSKSSCLISGRKNSSPSIYPENSKLHYGNAKNMTSPIARKRFEFELDRLVLRGTTLATRLLGEKLERWQRGEVVCLKHGTLGCCDRPPSWTSDGLNI